MKTFIKSVFLFCFFCSMYSQTLPKQDPDWDKSRFKEKPIDVTFINSNVDEETGIGETDYNDKEQYNKLLENCLIFLKGTITKIENNKGKYLENIGEYTSFISEYSKTKGDKALVFITDMEQQGELPFKESGKAKVFLLHKVHKGKSEEFDPYLLNTKEIFIIIFGCEKSIAKEKIEIVNSQSSFMTSLIELINLAGVVDKSGPGPDIIPIRAYHLNSKKIHPPSVINMGKDISIQLHEKCFFQFKAGLSYSIVSLTDFKFENEKLVINVNENDKTEWKDNLNAFLNFYIFGRDMDNFSSVFKMGGMSWCDPQRFGIFIGVKISKNPFNQLSLGGSYSFSHDLTLNVGVGLNKIPKDQEIDTNGNAVSVDNLIETVAKLKYDKPRLFIGLSFPPSILSSALAKKK